MTARLFHNEYLESRVLKRNPRAELLINVHF